MSRHRIAISLVLAMGSLAVCSSARADKYYVGPLNGVWSDPANWSDTPGGPGGAGVPGAGENAGFTDNDALDRTLILDVSAAVATLSVQNLGGGLSTVMQGPGVDLSATGQSLGYGVFARGAYTQTGGTNSVDWLRVGDIGGNPQTLSAGTYTLNGGTIISSGAIYVGNYQAHGTFLHNAGAVHAEGLTLGSNLTSNGTYGLANGTLVANRTVVGYSGRGTLIHSGGLLKTVRLELGRSTGIGEGTYILNGSGASLIVEGHESVGYRGKSAHFNQSGGSHYVGGNLSVGSIGGSGSYSYHMSGGSLTVIGGLINNDYSSRGDFLQTGGHVTVGTAEAPKRFQMRRYELSGDSSMHVTGSVTLGSYVQTGGCFIAGDLFHVGGGESSISGGTLTVLGRQFWSGTFNHTGGAVIIPSPSFQSVYTTYYLSGGTYTSPRLSPSRTFYWSGGELNIGTLVLAGSTVVTHDSGRTLVVNSIRRPDFIDYGYGTLDLTNNNAIIDYEADPALQISEIREFLATGHLISSTATPAHRLGYGDNADPLLQKSTFSGETFPANDFSQILVMYTLGGDANLDGLVNLVDLYALSQHWLGTDAFWTEGDFNYDGLVNKTDLGILAGNWGASEVSLEDVLVDAGLPAVAVPEPAMTALLAAIACIMRSRRKH